MPTGFFYIHWDLLRDIMNLPLDTKFEDIDLGNRDDVIRLMVSHPDIPESDEPINPHWQRVEPVQFVGWTREN